MDVKSKSALALALTVLFVFAAGMSLASAGNAVAASVWAGDNAQNCRNQFIVGETMHVYWSEAPSGSTVDIDVTDSVGTVLASWINQPEIANGTLSYTFSQPGYYFIKCSGAQPFPIAVATIFVVPESALGVLTALGAAFAAYGLMKIGRFKSL